jgi:dihydrofolate synthase/folylpolyglutamate synthase
LFYDDIITTIKKYEVAGSKFGLERTRTLLDKLGAPDDKLKIVHVAGTNGKGSICAYLTHILLSAGKMVGTFTSPEVYDYGEKFLLNGEQLEVQKLKGYLSEAYTLAQSMDDKPTAFEIETAAALYAFAQEGCEYAVVECGMGGLNDSTNAIRRKALAVISSISLEHTAVLGKTITEICRQKAGIIRDCPAVVNGLQTEETVNYFKNLNVTFANGELKILSSNLHGLTFTYRGEKYSINMLGSAQAYNAATAIEAAKILGITPPHITQGIKNTRLLGRVEVIEKSGITYILDGSHNPASFAPLTDILKGDKRQKVLLFGCLSDKDIGSAVNILSPYFSKAYVFAPDSYRAMAVDKICTSFSSAFEVTKKFDGVVSALESATDELVVVCGSFTILKEAKEWIDKRQ